MSLDIFAEFATDESLENNGTWRDFRGGVRLLIGRLGNEAYSKAITREVEKNRLVLDLGGEGARKLDFDLMGIALAEGVLLGWDGPMAFKKQPMEYSRENAIKLLSVKDFRAVVVAMAQELQSYRFKEEQAQGEA